MQVYQMCACSNAVCEFEVVLGQVSSRIRAAASSAAASISLMTAAAVNAARSVNHTDTSLSQLLITEYISRGI